jgi:hypothetical protein
MKHDFVNGETVYLMAGKRLMIGVISDGNCADDYKFSVIPVGERDYVSVRWNGKMGYGAPHYSSLYHTKKEALDDWREQELAKIDKIYKKYIK